MSRPTTIKLPPPIDIAAAAAAAAASPALKLSSRSRPRSASIVKVEEVGDYSVEEVLDRSAYANINADWVNAKGTFTPHFPEMRIAHPTPRRLVNTRRSHRRWQDHHRYFAGNDAANKLDARQLDISCGPRFVFAIHNYSHFDSCRISCSIGSRVYPLNEAYMPAHTTT
jgi:hypothetical protein